MSPHTPPETPTPPSVESGITRAALVMIVTVGIAASSIVMIGPQILVIVPLALVVGLFLALRRSFWSLVWFGYPFLFGLVSAWIGYKEMPGYERTVAFAISIGIGVVGVVMVAVGLWKALPGRKSKEGEAKE